ncbi:hypothetical protein sos41_15500 [Alphaproteobacteria bacterium SO-S41]|nr:hypothetical protein sos41_15500 [Alphaproteobacteria bacterium SO-S41]
MRLKFSAFLIGLSLIGASGTALAAPDKTLAQLCARICGGSWTNSDGPVTQFYRFEMDERYGVIRGRFGPSTDKPQTPSDSMIVYGFDKAAGGLWSVQSFRGEAPRLGTVRLESDGFTVVEQSSAGTVASAFTFDKTTMTQRTAVSSAAGGHIAEPIVYQRSK